MSVDPDEPCAQSELRVKQIVRPDGTTVPFVVPPKPVFVITSIEWNQHFGDPNTDHFFRLTLRGSQSAVVASTGTISDSGGARRRKGCRSRLASS